MIGVSHRQKGTIWIFQTNLSLNQYIVKIRLRHVMRPGTKSTLCSKCRFPITQSILRRNYKLVQQIYIIPVQCFGRISNCNIEISPKMVRLCILFFHFLKPFEFWIRISSNLTQRHIYDSSISPASVFQQYSNCIIINGGIKMKYP